MPLPCPPFLSNPYSPAEIICAYISAKLRKGRNRDAIARKLDALEDQFPTYAAEFEMARESYKLHVEAPPPYNEKDAMSIKEKKSCHVCDTCDVCYAASTTRPASSRAAIAARPTSTWPVTPATTSVKAKKTPPKKQWPIGPGAPNGPVGDTWDMVNPRPPKNLGVIWNPATPRPLPVGEMWNPQYGGKGDPFKRK